MTSSLGMVNRPAPGRVAVVVPARDEQRGITACLDSIGVAADILRSERPAVRVDLLVVADRCADATAEVAIAAGAAVLIADCGSAGGARRLGFAALLGDGDIASTWLATTDADSTVPRTWLSRQLAMAAAGVDMVLGMVRPTGLPAWAEAVWSARHGTDDGHPHVFGANLGVRADSYLACGGFAGLVDGEDAALAAAVRRSGGLVVSLGGAYVQTSGRLDGRGPGGFAGYLRDLVTDAPFARETPRSA